MAYNTDLVNGLANKSNNNHTHDNRYYTETEINNLLNNKANASHTHTISQVTNLQTTLNGKANSNHSHSASNITSGTLPLTRGGTGVTSIDALKELLGITKQNYKIKYGIYVRIEPSYSLIDYSDMNYTTTPAIFITLNDSYRNMGYSTMYSPVIISSSATSAEITIYYLKNNFSSIGETAGYINWLTIGV